MKKILNKIKNITFANLNLFQKTIIEQDSPQSLYRAQSITGWDFKTINETPLFQGNSSITFKEKLLIMMDQTPSELENNSTQQHAVQVFEALIDNAKKFLLIYDCDLSGDLLNHNHIVDLKAKFKNFLKNGDRKIEIIVPVKEKNSDEIISYLKSFDKAVKIHFINENSPIQNSKIKEIPYFAVNDSFSYRIELGKNKETPDRTAQFAFNDQVIGQYLTNIFNEIKATSNSPSDRRS